MTNGFAVRDLRSNARWAATLRHREELDETEVLYTFTGDQLRYLQSERTEAVVSEVTHGLRITGTGKIHRRLAILSLLNACCEALHNERDEGRAGVLWRTSTSEQPNTRYKCKLFAPAASRKAVDSLQDHGYLTFHKGGKDAKSFEPGRVSLVLPTGRLREVYEAVLAGPYEVVDPFKDERELLILEDDKKRLVDYTDTEATTRMREQLHAINAINCARTWTISVNGTDTRELSHYSLRVRRKFKHSSFSILGRFLCEAQGLPKATRRHLLIDGEPTVELDFSAMLPTIAYAQCGLASSDKTAWQLGSDPYIIPGYPRDMTKKWLLTCLNAESRTAALKSMWSSGYLEEPREAAGIIDALRKKHHPIAHLFFTEAWKDLLFEESEIMSAILTHCINFKRPILPIHDGLVCRAVDKTICSNFMRDAFEERYGFTPRIKAVDSTGQETEA